MDGQAGKVGNSGWTVAPIGAGRSSIGGTADKIPCGDGDQFVDVLRTAPAAFFVFQAEHVEQRFRRDHAGQGHLSDI